MPNKDLSIIKQFTDFYKQFYCYRKLFPKQDRHLLGAKCENLIIEIIALLLRAKFAASAGKRELIHSTSEKLDLLKVFIRLLSELKILPQNKYLILELQLHEIGKMLGGWIKFAA